MENRPIILQVPLVNPKGKTCELEMLCILFCLMIPSSALADEVRLRDGDVLAGTVLHSSDEQIILDHPGLGRLTIPAQAVDSFSVAAAPAGGTEGGRFCG